MESIVINIALSFIAVMGIVAIFAPHMADTLTQRVGLSFVSMGSMGMIAWCSKNQIPGPMTMFVVGVALFMAATACKLYRAYGGGRRRRRVTDRLELE